MKKSISIILLTFSMVFLFATSCHDDFLDRPPEDQVTVDNYFKSAAQLRILTGGLYNRTWFDYIDKAAVAIGDGMAGNGVTYDQLINRFFNFSVTADYTQLIYAWRSFWTCIGQAGAIINTVPDVETNEELTEGAKKEAIGEAKFIRALAYFYLVQLWGDIPIIQNHTDHVYDVEIPKAPVDDVYKFIISDLEYAEANCRTEDPGRVTIWTAKALLAKVYLTRATLNNSADDYQKAAEYAKEVMNSGVYSLLPNYSDLWLPENNNNVESIFALQWVACQQSNYWGTQNSLQAYFAADGTITEVGDGWSMVVPSLDLRDAYQQGDKRRKPTIMEDGFHYSQIWSDRGGYTYTKRKDDGSLRSNTGAHIKKYVVGTPADAEVCFMSTGLATPLIRYADVLLTYAEAVLAGSASTSDAEALKAFNEVRQRAGLSTMSTITLEDILQERRVEFAFEFQYWFDVKRYYNINPQAAIAYISNQERGTLDNEEEVLSLKITPIESDFLMPIPANDASANPKLLQDPVPYNFNE